MFSASLFFLRLECHFHGCCTSFNFRVLLTLFMSTAPIIVKKAWHVKKKFFRKALYSADLSTFPQEFHKKFSTEKVYLDFFQKSFTISCIQYLFLIFLDKFFIEPVDNFCYTKDNHALLYISTGFTATRLCYPQLVYNFVDNFFFFVKKLWTFRSVNYRISLKKTGFAAL